MHNDLGTLVLYELAHAEARKRVPRSYLEDLQARGWELMPGDAYATLFPASWIAKFVATMEARGRPTVDFNFQGGRGNDAVTKLMRSWVPRFAAAHFSDDDYLKFTEVMAEAHLRDAYTTLGPYDKTIGDMAWNPKAVNSAKYCGELLNSTDRADWVAYLRRLAPDGDAEPMPPFADVIRDRLVYQEPLYLEVLCNSRTTLTPAGDQPWSRRSYEALLCCSIPIVQRLEHVGRTEADLSLRYNVYVYDPARPRSDYEYNRQWATWNFHTAIRHSTLLDPGAFAGFECPDRGVAPR